MTVAFRREVAGDGVDVILIEPGSLDTGIWDKAEDDLLRRRELAPDRAAYHRSLVLLRRLRPTMPGPQIAAEAIGEALTAGRPRLRYEVGIDAPLVRLGEHLLPERFQDRLGRSVLGR